MPHIRTVEPQAEPISVADAAAYLRIVSSSDTPLVGDLISAARDMIEMFTGRALITQTWKLQLPRWFPCDPLFRYGPQYPLSYAWDWRNTCRSQGDYIELPRSPLQSVVSVQYYDTNNVLQTWDGTPGVNYIVDTVSIPGRIQLVDGVNWPDVATRPDAIQITFVAGYGSAPGSVPPALRQAVKFAVKHYYDNRDSIVVERATVDELPMTLRYLIEMLRVDFTA